MIVIDYQDRRPIYEQIVEKFQILILKGIMDANEQMPSVRKLAVELSINPNTIQKAYSMLEQQGYIYPVKGRGNFVSDKGALLKEKQKLFWEEYRQVIDKGKECIFEGGTAMIEMKGISKKFDQIQAVSKVSGEIREGSVFGLVGTNGAGKSTCLRMMSGILKADEGEVLVDGQDIYENEEMKREIFFISDDQYYFPNSTPKEMMEYYRMFSKGMKKQVSVLLGVCANTKYLLCDETFDGLDPVMRQAVKSIFALEIMNRNFTPVIASHNLRELEDICDHVGLLHKGGILLSKDLEEMKSNIQKLQCVVAEEEKMSLLQELDILQMEQRGSLLTLTVRGEREKIEAVLRGKNPVFYEILPLTLEEIFISETEVVGYDVKSLLL